MNHLSKMMEKTKHFSINLTGLCYKDFYKNSNSKGAGEPAHQRCLAKVFTARMIIQGSGGKLGQSDISLITHILTLSNSFACALEGLLTQNEKGRSPQLFIPDNIHDRLEWAFFGSNNAQTLCV